MEQTPSVKGQVSQEQTIDAMVQVVTSSKRFFKDRYATFATELKRNSVAFPLPNIGKNILMDNFSLC